MCTVTNNIVNTDSSLWTPLLAEDTRGQACVQYSVRCCMCGSTGHSLRRCLAPFKIVSPSSALISERTILTDLCLKHRNYVCMRQSRQRAFPATARFIGATLPRVTVSAILTKNKTRHLQLAPSRAGSAVPTAMACRPIFTGYTNPSHAGKARSRYSRHSLLDSSETVKPHM